MTTTRLPKLACAASAFALIATGLLSTTPAEARRGKDYFSETYIFNKPMDGYSGHAGAYYCDYQKKPNIVCSRDRNGNERCVRKGWQLRQHCY